MGWDDYNDNRDDPLDWDYLDYMNKTGIYEEPDIEEDPEDDLYLSGLDPNELEDMDDDARRAVLEEAGLDPDDYDFISSGSYRSRTHSSVTNTTEKAKSKGNVSPINTRPSSKSYSGNKWSILEFIIFITVISIIGFTIAAFVGEFFATIVIIIIAVIIFNCF